MSVWSSPRALGRQQHVLVAAGLGEVDALRAARLLVDLDHARAVGLHAAHLVLRVLEVVDLGEDVRLLAAVEHVARGVDARPDHQPRLDLLALGEDVERGRRRVVDRGHAVGEVRDVLPLGFGEELEAGVVQVRVRVDEARDDGLAGAVERFASRREPATVPDGPTAAIRLPVTKMSAFSRTSSPFIVTTRAPRRTNEPCGAGARHRERDRDRLGLRDARLLDLLLLLVVLSSFSCRRRVLLRGLLLRLLLGLAPLGARELDRARERRGGRTCCRAPTSSSCRRRPSARSRRRRRRGDRRGRRPP